MLIYFPLAALHDVKDFFLLGHEVHISTAGYEEGQLGLFFGKIF